MKNTKFMFKKPKTQHIENKLLTSKQTDYGIHFLLHRRGSECCFAFFHLRITKPNVTQEVSSKNR